GVGGWPAGGPGGAGDTSPPFAATTGRVPPSTPVTVTASYNGSATATLTVAAGLQLSTLTLNPTTVVAGDLSVGTVTLTGPAPAGGAVGPLSSGDPAGASIPARATIGAGGPPPNLTYLPRRPGATPRA